MLERRLTAWKTGLASVLDVIISTKKRNGADASAANAPNGLEASAQQPQEATA